MLQTFTEPSTLKRPQILELIRQWGDINTDGILDPSCRIFAIPDIEGFIGYKMESSNAVAFGDPVCAPEDKPILAQEFQNFCESQKLGTVYTLVSQEFADWAINNLSATSIEFGDKFVLDPQNHLLNNTGSKSGLIRKKVKHAVKEGIIVKEYLQEEPRIEEGIMEVVRSWLQKRRGPQVYLCQVNLFKDRMGKRYFYAEREGKIIGLLMLNAIQAKNGWLLNNLMIAKSTPNGLSELLVMTALETIAAENCSYVVVGPLVGHQLGRITGIGQMKENLIRWVFKLLKYVFSLDGQTTFWKKFEHNIEGCYLIFPKNNFGFTSLKALLQAFHVGK